MEPCRKRDSLKENHPTDLHDHPGYLNSSRLVKGMNPPTPLDLQLCPLASLPSSLWGLPCPFPPSLGADHCGPTGLGDYKIRLYHPDYVTPSIPPLFLSLLQGLFSQVSTKTRGRVSSPARSNRTNPFPLEEQGFLLEILSSFQEGWR